MQHKWHKEIKAWADGAEIEYRLPTGRWVTCDATEEPPQWLINIEYRIKQQPKEPQYLYVWLDKDTELAQLETHEPKGVLEDDLYKYIGKIKLEVDDE
jgi:NADH:ubiquinone oxidoreductase subunit